jgi:hypothetical protein
MTCATVSQVGTIDRSGRSGRHPHEPATRSAAAPAIMGPMSPTWIWMQSILVVLIIASIVIAITRLA